MRFYKLRGKIVKLLGEFLFELGRANDIYRLNHMLSKFMIDIKALRMESSEMVQQLESSFNNITKRKENNIG